MAALSDEIETLKIVHTYGVGLHSGSGTPAQVVAALQEAIDETGARRLLVETFSRAEARLFAREVIPALKR